MATFDQLRLQQLLKPFENQTGIVGTNQAIPMVNNVPMINTGQVLQNIQNQNLVDQIIAENRRKSVGDFINVPQTYYPPMTGGITQLLPLQNLGIDTSYGVANEPDEEQVEYLGDKPSGIEKLFDFLRNIPTPLNLARRGLGNLRQAYANFRRSDFVQSDNFMEFLQKRREKRAAAQRTADKARIDAAKAVRSGGDGGGRSFDTSAADRAGTSLGSGQFSPSSSRGRSGY